MRLILPAAVLLLVAASPLLGHGGGLDANGCHTDRKTGDYHCHGTPRRSGSSRSAPVASPPPASSSSSSSASPAPAPRAQGLMSTASPRASMAEAPAPGGGSITLSSAPIDADLVKTAQLLLPTLGIDAGAVTGEVSDQTAAAVRRYQAGKKLPENGRITSGLLVLISRDVLDAARARHNRIQELERAYGAVPAKPTG